MIKLFFRGFKKIGKDNNGQVMLFTALVILVLACFFALVVDVGQLVTWRIRMQSAVDAGALAAGTWQARGLNQLQFLNDTHWSLRAAQAAINFVYVAEFIADSAASWGFGTPFYWIRLRNQVRRTDRMFSPLVRATLTAQRVIKNTYPFIAAGAALSVGRDNDADIVAPIRPMPNPCTLGAKEENHNGNLFFYEMPGWMFVWTISWDDPGFYGGSPEPVTFTGYKGRQDASQTFLLLPGLIKSAGGEDLTVPAMTTMASVWTRKDPEEDGDTQLSDECLVRGGPWVWSRDFTTSLSPVVLPFNLSGRYGLIYH